jgi:hypothetical protein
MRSINALKKFIWVTWESWTLGLEVVDHCEYYRSLPSNGVSMGLLILSPKRLPVGRFGLYLYQEARLDGPAMLLMHHVLVRADESRAWCKIDQSLNESSGQQTLLRQKEASRGFLDEFLSPSWCFMGRKDRLSFGANFQSYFVCGVQLKTRVAGCRPRSDDRHRLLKRYTNSRGERNK